MRFKDQEVLKSVDLVIEKGAFFGLLGPSGAGKTTLIKILTGQLKASGGEAKVFGMTSQNLSDEIYEKMGMVLDDSGLYTRLSCYDNLKIFAKIYGVPKTKIMTALEAVKLEAFAKKSVDDLSKGMKQRLVLARAMMHDPELLFLDEPTSGLDPLTMQEIHKLILALRDKGTTVFLTTHNMVEATKLCDQVALLNEGIILEKGHPLDICRQHDKQKTISILLKSGEEKELINGPSAAKEIGAYLEQDMIETIHSSEPNLESVFIHLTGRELDM